MRSSKMLFLLITTLLFASLGNGFAQAPSKQLVVAVPAIPETLDPIFTGSQMSRYMRDTLYDVVPMFETTKDALGNTVADVSKAPICNLCESYSIAPDKMKWVVKFKSGIRSPAGNELTSDDAVWSFDRMLKAGSPTLKGYFDTFSIDMNNPVTVVDRYTWNINLTRPDFGLFSVWAAPHPFGKIYDSVEIKKRAAPDDPWGNQWLKTHIAGFGPWTIEKYTPGSELRLKRNANYHRPGIPKVDSVVFKEVPSEATRASLLRSGSVDVALQLTPRLIESLRSTKGIRAIDIASNQWMAWLLNAAMPPFDDVRVRQAMAYAAPIKEIIRTVYLNQPFVSRWSGYAPANFMGAPVAWPYDENLEKARALLREAGKENIKFEIVYETNVAGSEEVAIIIKSQLAKIGVEVEPKGLAQAQYSEQYRARKSQSVLFEDASWGSDGRYWLSTFFQSKGAVNHGNHKNPEFDKIVDDITPISDLPQRTAMSKKAHELLVQDVPWAFAIGTGFSVVMRDNIDGFIWHLNNWVDTRDLNKK